MSQDDSDAATGSNDDNASAEATRQTSLFEAFLQEKSQDYSTWKASKDAEYTTWASEKNQENSNWKTENESENTAWKSERNQDFINWKAANDGDYGKWKSDKDNDYQAWKSIKDQDHINWKTEKDADVNAWKLTKDSEFNSWKSEKTNDYVNWRGERDQDFNNFKNERINEFKLFSEEKNAEFSNLILDFENRKKEWVEKVSAENVEWVGKNDEGITKWRSELQEQKNNLFEEMKAEVDNLKKSLEEEIRSLLPEAGAAGLSSAYFNAKTKYGVTPFDANSYSKNRIKFVIHYVKSFATPTFFYALFLGPLAGVAYLVTVLLQELGHANKESPFSIETWLLRIAISLPLATIAAFGWSSIRLYRLLYEEYNHKQRVMQLYHAFKGEVDEVGTSEQRQALISIMLTAVADKPTLSMRRYDRDSVEVIKMIADKLFPQVKKE
jgi:hypothetical protein